MVSQYVVSDVDRIISTPGDWERSIRGYSGPAFYLRRIPSLQSYICELLDVFVRIVVGSFGAADSLDWGGVWTASHCDRFHASIDSHQFAEKGASRRAVAVVHLFKLPCQNVQDEWNTETRESSP
jgi:hypothetical protein